jgi:hypothetical protein
MGQLDLQVQPVLLVPQVLQVLQALLELTEQLVQLVLQDQLVRQALVQMQYQSR